ncbi:MAG: hypothetical protein MK135_10240 [Polyangiaceae bacterium]|nr:hypothetical protein [Polyangiaceae bacterium]
MHPKKKTKIFITCQLALLVTLLMSSSAFAAGIIRSPGQHNRYEFEIEPQLGYWYGNAAEGAGPSVRVAIPILQNGPIGTINNNIAVSFGAGSFFALSDCLSPDPFRYCNVPGRSLVWLSLPGAFQWNFYFTKIISVVGEVGLDFAIPVGSGNGRSLLVNPLFQGGGRFQFGKVGVLVRVGYPMISVGCNLQF